MDDCSRIIQAMRSSSDHSESISVDEKVTDCECTEAGYCERHQCQKTPYLFAMCQRASDLFRRWELGEGPGQFQSRQAVARTHGQCRHREKELRTEVCPTCRGHVALKVFKCELHNECTILLALPALASCVTCNDFSSDK